MTHRQRTEIAVSVVIPLLRGREADLAGIAAWTRQTLPTGRFEVVAVSPGERVRDDRARRLLRDGDRLVIAPGMAETGLWDAGARAARGRVLVLTECHAIPRPGCLAAALSALNEGSDVACFESEAPKLTAAAWLEDAVFQNLFDRYVDTGDPRAISLRGIALSRDLYLRSGGLLSDDHECFAERALAARLMTIGARIVRARGAVVEHVPNTQFQKLRQDCLDYHRDAVHACLGGSAGEFDADVHLDLMPEWDSRARFDPALNRAALPGMVRLALSGGRSGRVVRRALPQAVIRGAFGPRIAAWVAYIRCRLLSAYLGVAWWLGQRPNPIPTWSMVARASVLRILCERPAGDWAGRLQLSADSVPVTAEHLGAHAAGLHLVERFNGRAFRWTEPVVVLNVALPFEAAGVTVRLLGVRVLRQGEVTAAWGRRPVAPSALDINESAITIWLPASARGPLTLAVAGMESKSDGRRLGIPIVEVAAFALSNQPRGTKATGATEQT